MEIESLTNLQRELLKVYSREVEDEDVVAIKKMLANYFAEKAIRMADVVWDEKGWTSSNSKDLMQEHNRKASQR